MDHEAIPASKENLEKEEVEGAFRIKRFGIKILTGM